MTIKDVIENIKIEIEGYKTKLGYPNTNYYFFETMIYQSEKYLPDLEKANELQEEMISRLIKCYKHAHSENDIKFIEKITNKPWEEINER